MMTKKNRSKLKNHRGFNNRLNILFPAPSIFMGILCISLNVYAVPIQMKNKPLEAMQYLGQDAGIKNSLLQVEHYLHQGEVMQALILVQEVANAHPDNPAVLMALASTQENAGMTADAVSTLSALIKLKPQLYQAYYYLAMLQLQHKHYDSARNNLKQALRLKADYSDARIALGQLDIASKDYDAAFITANHLQKTYPEAAWGYELEGDIYTIRLEHKNAVEAYTLAFARDAGSQLAAKLFRSRIKAGEGRVAYDELRQWLARHPGDISARSLLSSAQLSLASAQIKTRRYRQAAVIYQDILSYDPDNIVALNNMALLYVKEGNPEGLKLAERGYNLFPERPEMIDTLGWLLVNNGETKRGLLLLQEASRKAPQNSEIHYHIAVALDKAGKRRKALEELDRLLKDNKPFSSQHEAEAMRKRLSE